MFATIPVIPTEKENIVSSTSRTTFLVPENEKRFSSASEIEFSENVERLKFTSQFTVEKLRKYTSS
jgi:hypothetical protein